MSYFKEVSPESLDIKAEGITGFLDALERKGLEIHSLKVIRHGRSCASTWYEPYTSETLHPIYSFSKSFTAAAIGFACQEGILSLDDRIVDIFPEFCPEEISDHLSKVKIHHLLSMSCGQETQIDTCDTSPDWIREFLAHPFIHEPGTFYYYNTPGTNMLCAVISKLTGQSVEDYLRPRLFEPLGIDSVYYYRLKDSMNTCHGGGGMKLTTESMARFAYFMLHDGEWEGKKLLSGWYEKAAIKQMETLGDSEGHIKEWGNGYGYQCWMGSLPHSFRADGAFGQFGFVFPTLDLIVVTTAATEQTQTFVDCMYEYLIPSVCPDGTLCDEKETDLSELLSHKKIPALLACRNPEMENELDHIPFHSEEAKNTPELMSSLEKLIGGSGLFELSDDTAITDMEFSFSEDSVCWKVTDGGIMKEIKASLQGEFTKNKIGDFYYAATAKWRAQRALEMEIRRIDAISGVKLIFRFEKDSLRLEADDTLMTFGGLGIHERKVIPFYR